MDSLQTLTYGDLHVSIDPYGAQLCHLIKGTHEYLWQGDSRWWDEHAPLLFPIVGALRNNQAYSDQGICTLPRYGLARTMLHDVMLANKHAVPFRCKANPDTLAHYPYPFCLEMTYELIDDSTLMQTYVVSTTGDNAMPFCHGGHPAFTIPLCDGESFDEYELHFSCPFDVVTPRVTDEGLLDYSNMTSYGTDIERLRMSYELFAHDALVLEEVPDNALTLLGPHGHGVRIDFAGFDHIGLWSAVPDSDGIPAAFVALESWCGTATRTDEDDVFEHKQNMLWVQPGQTVTRAFTIHDL